MNTAIRADGERRPGHGRPAAGGRRAAAGRRRRRVDRGVRRRDRRRDPGARAEPVPRVPQPARRHRGGACATAGSRPATSRRATPDGYIRIVGRRATDLIKSGGYKIGAGEIENALLEHPAVAEAAVTGEPDDDLGERIVAWIVAAGDDKPRERELADHVARLLTPHKRPREVRYLDELPRNAMGKVTKATLRVLIPRQLLRYRADDLR